MCWAENEIGLQRNPCVFLIAKAGPPSPLLGCAVSNVTTTSLTVQCYADDQTIASPPQFFAHLGKQSELQEKGTLDHKKVVSSSAVPVFHFHGLAPGTSYVIELYAENGIGKGEPSYLSVTTLSTRNTKLG